jgi:hypothetical protein
MKLYYAKTGDKTCKHCGCSITREQVYVVEQITLYGERAQQKCFMIFHYDCYIPWKQKKLQQKYDAFVLSHRKPTRMGRKPLPCLDRPRKQKLQCLRAYHAKAGNLQRVWEIDREILALSGIDPCVIMKGTSITEGGSVCQDKQESPVVEVPDQKSQLSIGEMLITPMSTEPQIPPSTTLPLESPQPSRLRPNLNPSPSNPLKEEELSNFNKEK